MPAWLSLLAISFLTLYFELLIVRWLPTEIRILAYFSNVTLITAVLGMGVGTLVWTRSRFRPEHAYWLFAALIAVTYLYGGLDIALPLATTSNFVWNGLSRAATGTPSQYLALLFFLALNTAAFVPLGQMLGKAFDQLPPIRAYSVNVFGAILGIAAFALFSLLGLPPAIWFLVGFALLAPLLPRTRGVLAGHRLHGAGPGRVVSRRHALVALLQDRRGRHQRSRPAGRLRGAGQPGFSPTGAGSVRAVRRPRRHDHAAAHLRRALSLWNQRRRADRRRGHR
jgi:hypothetical protein